jgi:hypothetical protein
MLGFVEQRAQVRLADTESFPDHMRNFERGVILAAHG